MSRTMSDPVLVVVHDKDHNHAIIHIVMCENEFTASRIQNRLDKDPKYSLPCYYNERMFVERFFENDLTPDDHKTV